MLQNHMSNVDKWQLRWRYNIVICIFNETEVNAVNANFNTPAKKEKKDYFTIVNAGKF